MTRERQPAVTGKTDAERELVAYRLGPGAPEIIPAPARRDWMDATQGRYAYRCLPLSVANQNGWVLLNPSGFEVMWNGGARADGLRFRLDGEPQPVPVASVFGSGIVTWRVPYLFRTPPGWELQVRGPTNYVKRGAVALDGLVETDWAVATFTMNWKITSTFRWVRFDKGEPFCMIQPQRRSDLESFAPRIRDLASEPELAAEFTTWAEGRADFVFERMASSPEARRQRWQKDYFKGASPGGASADEHRVRLAVRPFVDTATGERGDNDPALWHHYARRSLGLGAGKPLRARLRAWARFWLGPLLR